MAIPAVLAGLGGRAAAGGMAGRAGQFAGMGMASNMLSGGSDTPDPFTSMDRMVSNEPTPMTMDQTSNDLPFGF